jgi:putative ABC transport system permease protein
VPGFEEVGFISTPPLGRAEQSAPATVKTEAQSVEEALRNPYVTYESISENYFQLVGIPLREGRFFSKFDGKDTEPVVILSARLARTLWGENAAVGQRLRYDPSAEKPGPLRKVVGIVGDVQEPDLGGEAGLDFYVPYRQQAESNQYILVRTRKNLREFTRLAEQAMWNIDPEQSVFDFATYDDRILSGIWQLRISRLLLVLFSGVALLLAIIGIYSVTSYVVGQRRRELGIRMALGATAQSVRSLIVGRGILLGSIGLALGALGAGVLGQVLRHLLRGIPRIDGVSFLAALTVLFTATLTASAVPAWRASRVDPVSALRDE